MSQHTYTAEIAWAGSTGGGYRAYSRDHRVRFGAHSWQLSADAAFRGDPDLPNPESLVVAAASSCQLLSFLAVAALADVEVVAYADDAAGAMPIRTASMAIETIELRPHIVVRGADVGTVAELVERAHEQCYIAHSLTAEVRVVPRIEVVA
jgi:organic hydroperoxide reductase OsmC/OhrA